MIITDTGIYPGNLKPGDVLIQENGNIHPCNGCLDCWLKTPGVCTYRDSMMKISSLLEKTDELVVVSYCLYGTFSGFVQKVFERLMPYFRPEYDNEDGYMVHKRRSKQEIAVSVYFYGSELSESERKSAQAAVKRMTVKLGGRVKRIMFSNEAMQIGGLA